VAKGITRLPDQVLTFWHDTLMMVWPPTIPYPQSLTYRPRTGYMYLVFGMTMGKVRDFATGDTLTTDDYYFEHRHGQMRWHKDPGVESIYDFEYPHWLEITAEDPVEMRFYNNTGLSIIQDFSIWMFECGTEQWKEHVLPYLKGHYNLFSALGKMSEEELRVALGTLKKGVAG